MTLREALGGDVQRIYDHVDALLDREDGMVALFDGSRVLTYAHGFGASASQLELLGVELERALHNVVGARPARKERRNHERDQRTQRDRHDSGDGHRRARGLLQLARKIA
jgi:hypothetical protein